MNGMLSYLLSDHIGSSSVTTDANGAKTASAQREDASLGIYWFQSRWFDPSLGRFTQPDTIVPTGSQGTQAWDRYAFVNNNPVRYTDPTGHMMDQGDGGGCLLMDCIIEEQDRVISEEEERRKKCEAGDERYCSYAELHPVETAVFIFSGLALGGAGELLHLGLGLACEVFDCAEYSGIGPIESPIGYPPNTGAAPIPGWRWRGSPGGEGSSEGQWYNPDNPGESIHWDPSHHTGTSPEGHWDYVAPDGMEFWLWPDGTMTPK